ncbi:MAG TPA: hypothetical protein VNO86_02605 [Candidatus Binatia bacterium]|nr:hypothetical protein [Candidatus Binatia bacterium]
MRTILVLALWLLAGWNLGAFLEFGIGLPTWLGVVGGLGAGLLAVRSTLRSAAGRGLAPSRLSFHRR